MCLPPLNTGLTKNLAGEKSNTSTSKEIELVKERKFICSLDLLLELFVGR